MGVAFKPNNRTALLQNISGIYGGVAVLLKQPAFMLSPMEAQGMSTSLADVLDFHEINITDGGGVWGLYLALIITWYGPTAARLNILKNGKGQIIEGVATAAATPGDAANGNVHKMDFTTDVAQPEKGTIADVMEENPRGVFNYG